MNPTNYELAEKGINESVFVGGTDDARITAINASTYATLALVDEIRSMHDAVIEGVSSTLVDAVNLEPAEGHDGITTFHLCHTAAQAVIERANRTGMFDLEEVRAVREFNPDKFRGFELFSVAVKMVQP